MASSHFNNPFSLTFRLLSLSLAAAIITSIFILGHDPEAAVSMGWPPPLDKLQHAIAFGVIASLIRMGTVRPSFLLIGVFVVALGALDEYLQIPLPFRSASLFDLMADGVGVTSALLFFRVIAGRNDEDKKINFDED